LGDTFIPANPLPSQQRLHQVLLYEPETGIFRWREDKGRMKAGDIAGDRTGNGYWRLRVDMVRYAAHRLAWKYVHGVDPSIYIDHINGNRLDNRICNLREADTNQNLFNGTPKAGKAVQYRGVNIRRRKSGRETFYAIITAHGKGHWLGTFQSAEAASAAYEAKAKELFGEYTRAA
jgi:hypothetical protein